MIEISLRQAVGQLRRMSQDQRFILPPAILALHPSPVTPVETKR